MSKKPRDHASSPDATPVVAPAPQANAAPEVSTAPKITAISVIPTKDGWVALTYVIQGSAVLSVRATEPNLKAIAVEEAKRALVPILMNDGGGLA